MRLKGKRCDSQSHRKTRRQSERRRGSNSLDSQRSLTRHGSKRELQGRGSSGKSVKRAAITNYGKSSHHFEELLRGQWRGDSAHFYFFSEKWQLQASLRGVTASQQRKGIATKNRIEEMRQKKETRQQKEKFIILFNFRNFVTERPQCHSSSDKFIDSRSTHGSQEYSFQMTQG